MKKNNFSIFVMGALILSVLIGILLQKNIDIADRFSIFGTLYINLIKMIMIPMVFTSLVMGISNMTSLKELGKIGLMTVSIFLITTACAVIIGIIISSLFKPGMGIALSNETYEVTGFPNIEDIIIGIIPSNIVVAFNDGNMLQIIFISVVMGIGIVKCGKNSENVNKIIGELYNVVSNLTKGIMYFTPLGIMGLMIPVVAKNGLNVLLPLIKVIIIFYLAVAIQIIFVYCVLLKIGARISIKDFFKGMYPAQIVAFTSCSSAAVLPISMQRAQDELKLSKEVSGFVLPLGATINMDGNALYQGIVALFIAQAYGIKLTLPMIFMIVITGTIASIGAAGIPGAGMIVLSTVLVSAGLPVDGVVLVAGIDRILDMGRTLVNITGDVVTAGVINRAIGAKNINNQKELF